MAGMAATAWWGLAACALGVKRELTEQNIGAAFVASVEPTQTMFNDDSLASLPNIPFSCSDVEQKVHDLIGLLLCNGHWTVANTRRNS